MTDHQYINVDEALNEQVAMLQKIRRHYINSQEVLNRRVDTMFDNNDRYLFDRNIESTPELKNLKRLKFPKLTLALIITEIMVHGREDEKALIQKMYPKEEIINYMAFADRTITAKENHVNAHRVIKASEAEDDETYGFDHVNDIDDQRPRHSLRG